MKDPLKMLVRDEYPCGCDFEAGPIFSQADAQAKCPAACASHGGWSGQWDTTVPGEMSVCGCNQCAAP